MMKIMHTELKAYSFSACSLKYTLNSVNGQRHSPCFYCQHRATGHEAYSGDGVLHRKLKSLWAVAADAMNDSTNTLNFVSWVEGQVQYWSLKQNAFI